MEAAPISPIWAIVFFLVFLYLMIGLGSVVNQDDHKDFSYEIIKILIWPILWIVWLCIALKDVLGDLFHGKL